MRERRGRRRRGRTKPNITAELEPCFVIGERRSREVEQEEENEEEEE